MVENKTLSLTDEIYAELVDGLKTGLDYTHLQAKHGASKGPFYNALGRLFHDMEPKVRALNEVQAKLDQAGLRLDSLDQKIKEAEGSLAPLEEKRSILNEEIETLETKLGEKSKLLEHAAELGKLGFDIERLRQLREALTEIGAKHGLKGKEAITKFFGDLQDYDAKTGFEQEIQRLGIITETKKLEAEKWQAEAESLSRRNKDLGEAIAAVQSLAKHGVKVEQIISWNGIVSKLGGPDELQDKLGRYKSMSELLDADRRGIEECDKKITELGAQIKALEEQKVEIEAAIKSLSTSGVKEITKVSDKAMTLLKSLSNSEVEEISKVSDKGIAEVKSLLAELKGETKRLADLKAEAGKLEKELMYARYLTTSDETVLAALPKELVLAFFDRAATWCKLKQLNPAVKMPQSVSRKFAFVNASTQLDLLDLIAWAEAGLEGANQ